MTDTPGNEYSNPVSGCLSSLSPFGYIVISTGWVSMPGWGLWWCWCSFLPTYKYLLELFWGLDWMVVIHLRFIATLNYWMLHISSPISIRLPRRSPTTTWFTPRGYLGEIKYIEAISPEMSSIEVVLSSCTTPQPAVAEEVLLGQVQ